MCVLTCVVCVQEIKALMQQGVQETPTFNAYMMKGKLTDYESQVCVCVCVCVCDSMCACKCLHVDLCIWQPCVCVCVCVCVCIMQLTSSVANSYNQADDKGKKALLKASKHVQVSTARPHLHCTHILAYPHGAFLASPPALLQFCTCACQSLQERAGQ